MFHPLYRQTQKNIDDFHGLLENTRVSSEQSLPTTVWNDVMARTEKLLMECSEVMRQEIDVEKRRALKEKLAQLQTDYDTYKALANRYKAEKTQLDQRNQLLAGSQISQRHGNGASVNIDLETILLNQNDALRRGGNQLDDFIAMGSNTLQVLQGQRNALKKTHKVLLDAANRLGLSQSIIKVIEMRTVQEKYIFWGCVIFSLIVFYYTWSFFRN